MVPKEINVDRVVESSSRHRLRKSLRSSSECEGANHWLRTASEKCSHFSRRCLCKESEKNAVVGVNVARVRTVLPGAEKVGKRQFFENATGKCDAHGATTRTRARPTRMSIFPYVAGRVGSFYLQQTHTHTHTQTQTRSVASDARA